MDVSRLRDLARGEGQVLDIQDQMMRASCAYFAAEVLRGPPGPPYNGRFIVADHHLEWDELITNHDRVCINAPRDHGKTYFLDFAFPIWQAAFTPHGRGYIFSATQDQAVRILEDIREEVEGNPRLAHLAPRDKKRAWSKTRLTLENGHKIYARGYGTKIRGAHPDWIVVDDALNDEDAYSELVRRKHIDYFYTAITNMVVPGGKIVVVGTPFHGADLYATLEKNPRYAFRRYPALSDGKALWPERYCATKAQRLEAASRGVVVESLEERRLEIGNVRFTREFLCQPVSDDMSLFPSRLFQGDPVEVYQAAMGRPRDYYRELGIDQFFIGFDFAVSSSTAADYTVGFVLGLDGQGNRWVVDIQRHKGLPYARQKSLINALGRKYDPELIYLESNQLQRIFGDDLIRETDLPIFKFVTSGTKRDSKKQPSGNTHTQNKNTLEGGVPSLRVLLENRKIRIPVGDEESLEKARIWIDEMRNFTWLDGKLQGVGSHDDTVMAFWIANCAVRAGAFSATFGGESVSLDEVLAEQTREPEVVDVGDDPVADLLGSWGMSRDPETVDDVVTRILGPDEDPDPVTPARDPVDEVVARTWASLPGLAGRGFGE